MDRAHERLRDSAARLADEAAARQPGGPGGDDPEALHRPARENLIPFVKATKPDRYRRDGTLVPGYVVRPVHEYIAHHLELVERGLIRKLLIQVQPRIGKSELSTVRFPAWWVGRRPDDHVILASYGNNHAKRFGRQTRNIAETGEYAGIFPGVRPSRDSRAANEWNVEGRDGGVLSVGIGGAVTGTGGDLIVGDDPVKSRKDADSAAYRDTTWEWWNDTLMTRRAHDQVPTVLSMTRWHLDDLGGRLLDREKGEWTVVRLPALAEPNDPLGRQPGEALWEDKFSAAFLRSLQASDMDFDALYQQNPVSRAGAIFHREDFARFDNADPRLSRRAIARWISWDTALKDKATSDYTAYCVLELMPDYLLYVRHVQRLRLRFPDLPSTIEDVAARWNRDEKLRGVIIEDKGSGTSAYQTLLSSAAPWLRGLLNAYEPPGSKEYRASLASTWPRLGCVLLPLPNDAAPWLADFEDELFAFPGVAHDDQTDAFSQGVLYVEHFLAEGLQARTAAAADTDAPQVGYRPALWTPTR